jgi:outer membrane protein
MVMRGVLDRTVVAALALQAVLSIAGTPLVAQEAPAARTLTLEEALRTSVQQNRELQAARMQLSGAEGQVREAWSAVYPKLNANATYTRNVEVPGQFMPARFFDPNAGEADQVLVRFGADNSWMGQMRLEQPLFQASAFIGVGAAARYRSLQEEIVRGKTQEIATRTKQRYFDVLLAQESERLNAESVRRVRETLTEMQAMQRAGLVGEYDVLRLEVELANLEPALLRAQSQVRAARRTLAVELALEDAEGVSVEGSLTGTSLGAAEAADAPLLRSFGLEADRGAEELIELARRNRSELLQLRLTEELRTAELRAEQSEYLPKVSLFATYAYSAQSDGGVNPFAFAGARSFTTPQVGLQVTLPIFSGFSRPARVDQRRATVQQTATQYRDAVAQVENQVRTLADQVQEARQRAEAQQRATVQARRGYDIARIQFREGMGSRLELTDAEVALRQSEFNYAQAVHDYLNARTQLDQAVGVVPDLR